MMRRLAALAIITALFATRSAWAATGYWTGAVNNYWNETGNWNGLGSSRPLPTNDEMKFDSSHYYNELRDFVEERCFIDFSTIVMILSEPSKVRSLSYISPIGW